MKRRIASSLALAASLLVASVPALADGAADEKAAAKLFREGREALERGDLATACPRFAASLERVKRSGTLFNLAICEEKAGHLIRAQTLVEDGIRLLPSNDDRLGPSRKQAAEIDARIPRLTISLAPGVPKSARVDRDGVSVSSIGVEERLDPGKHEITLHVEGQPDQHTTVDLRERERRVISLGVASAVPDEGASSSGGGMRIAGFAVMGVGVATFGVGVATGLLTLGKKHEVEDNCVGGCNDAARDAANAGKTLSLVSTVTFIGGLAAAGAGTVLVVASARGPKKSAVFAPSLLPGGGGVTIGGRF